MSAPAWTDYHAKTKVDKKIICFEITDNIPLLYSIGFVYIN